MAHAKADHDRQGLADDCINGDANICHPIVIRFRQNTVSAQGYQWFGLDKDWPDAVQHPRKPSLFGQSRMSLDGVMVPGDGIEPPTP